jgi:Zn-dependent M16 (insulinase) family peptidase
MEVGEKIGGYVVNRKEPIEHLQGTYYELTHEPTGARHIHIAVPDDNNSFNVMFPTVPQDSSGVAHILEHCALAGSERYPIRDPFFSMIPRSLKTFMNAFTSADATWYPFSTRNEKDFFNLLSVYLNAAFFPRLEERAFKQEGHRLEFETIDDPDSGLRFKGVVFNEMKGGLASPPQVVDEAIGEALYPDLTYAYNSGGEPEHIPELTWKKLREFHHTHYHPSNSYFFTYGDLDPKRVLAEIEKEALSEFDRIDVDIDVPDQKPFETPREFRTTYPLSPDEDPSKKSQVLIGWKTAHVFDSFEMLALKVLKEVLLGNAASPLRKALIGSGLGDALADGTGLHTEYREPPFLAGLKNVDPDDAEQIELIIMETLRELADSGLDREQIDAAVHQLEIDQREVSNAGYPYSLKVFSGMAGAYAFGGDPYKSLKFDEDLERLHSEMNSGPFFENLIKQYFIDNPHRARLVVTPDREQEDRQRQSELARLAEIEAKLSAADKAAIVEETVALKEHQEAKEDISVLPTLELNDVPMQFEDVAHSIDQVAGARVGVFPMPTNGLTYIDIRMDYSALPNELKNRLALFAYAVPKMGAGDDDYLRMASRIDSYTGGVGVSAAVRPLAAGDGSFLQPILLSGKALARNHQPLVDILRDFLTGVFFDPKRLKEVIAELAVQKEAQVVYGGTQFAILLASAKFGPAALLDERLIGLTQLALLKETSSKRDESIDEVIADLEQIRDRLFVNRGIQICVTSEEKYLDEIKSLLEAALSALPQGDGEKPQEVPAPQGRQHEARTISAPVAFNAKVFRAVGYAHEDAPALTVLGNYMGDNFLHREIREKGGAYGSFSGLDREKGLFAMGSYRDPNIVRTYEVFEAAIREITKGEIEADKLKESILSSCSDVDPLLSPDTKGRRRFFNDISGYTLELQERFKRGLLTVKEEDLRRVADTYLSVNDAVMTTVAGQPLVEEANRQMGNVFEVSPV